MNKILFKFCPCLRIMSVLFLINFIYYNFVSVILVTDCVFGPTVNYLFNNTQEV
jgi:hypothetical protein